MIISLKKRNWKETLNKTANPKGTKECPRTKTLCNIVGLLGKLTVYKNLYCWTNLCYFFEIKNTNVLKTQLKCFKLVGFRKDQVISYKTA